MIFLKALHKNKGWGSLMVQMVKNLLVMQETWVRSLGGEDPLEKAMAPHSSILAWRKPWTEEPGRLQSMGSYRVWHDWVINTFTYIKMKELMCTDKGYPLKEWVSEWKLLSRVRLFSTPWTLQSMESPGQNIRVGSLSLLQQIFPTQESNRGLLHVRQILYQLSYEGSPSLKNL